MTGAEAKAFFKNYPDKRLLLSALSGNLTRKQSSILIKVDIEGLTLQEASDELSISLSALKRHRDKAYLTISKLLSKYPALLS